MICTGLRGRTRDDERLSAVLSPLPRRVSAHRAAAILQRIFGRGAAGLAFRLWDGTFVALGESTPVCTAVVHRPETFSRLIQDPTPLTFAEAYVDGSIDLEGDLFAAMTIANALDEFHLSFRDRLRVFFALWRG
jgi:cyclopropane-fatty-acyl-phospholipid synthase